VVRLVTSGTGHVWRRSDRLFLRTVQATPEGDAWPGGRLDQEPGSPCLGSAADNSFKRVRTIVSPPPNKAIEMRFRRFIDYMASPPLEKEADVNLVRHEIVGQLLKHDALLARFSDLDQERLRKFHAEGPFYKGASEQAC